MRAPVLKVDRGRRFHHVVDAQCANPENTHRRKCPSRCVRRAVLFLTRAYFYAVIAGAFVFV